MAGMSPAFDARVKAALPVGTSDTILGKVLTVNGFQRQDWTTRVDERHSAYRQEAAMACNLDFWVYWSSDASGALTAVQGKEIAFCL
jgi:hypothetical protein